MTGIETTDPQLARRRLVLEQQRDALRALVHRLIDLRRLVPRDTVEWRSPASRRYTERLEYLDDTLESASRECADGASAASVALVRLPSESGSPLVPGSPGEGPPRREFPVWESPRSGTAR